MTSIAEEHMGFADELNDAKLLNLAVEPVSYTHLRAHET